tara:strand:+ start:17 stop:361 length:345 start_codon:yes stop_codon:yes gene_type:complete
MGLTTKRAITYSYDHIRHFAWALAGQQCDCEYSKWQRLARLMEWVNERFGSFSSAPEFPGPDEEISDERTEALATWWDNHEEYAWEKILAWFYGKLDVVSSAIYNRYPFVEEDK